MILLFKALHFGSLPSLPSMVCFSLLLLFSLFSSHAPPLRLADCSSSMVCFSLLLLFLFFLLMLLHYAWLSHPASWLSFSCDCQSCYRNSIWWLRCDDNQHPFLGADGVDGRWSIPIQVTFEGHWMHMTRTVLFLFLFSLFLSCLLSSLSDRFNLQNTFNLLRIYKKVTFIGGLYRFQESPCLLILLVLYHPRWCINHAHTHGF